MSTITLEAKEKREITSGTKEWADYNINCLKGCSNDCRYCYAKIMARRFGRCKSGMWNQVKIRKDVLEKNFRKYNGRVMFPSSHDIVDTPEAKEACFTVISKLLKAGNDLLITTKPRQSVVRDITKIFASFKQRIQFRFTITSLDDKVLSFWEPNAPTFQERLASLRYAYKKGFKTSVSIEPFLDDNPKELVINLQPYVTESIWIGPMNYIPREGLSSQDKPEYERIRKICETDHLRAIFEDLRSTPLIRFKDSMSIRLGIPTTQSASTLQTQKRKGS